MRGRETIESLDTGCRIGLKYSWTKILRIRDVF